MTEDLSKNTLLVLVVLTIIISLLGTWTVISESSKMASSSPFTPGNPEASGKVTIDIQPPVQNVAVVGQVILNIVPEE